VNKKARTFSPWSHLVSLIYAQLTHAIGLNDICDGLRLHSGPLVTLRGATPPRRNNLSHANKERDATLAERIFWSVLDHLQTLQPGFARGIRGKGVARRFRRIIHVVDSTTIQLVGSCMDWAKHRRRKAAAKCHLHLDLHSFLPRFAIIDTARENDGKRSRELCAAIRAGEIVVFDKAYLDFAHLFDLLKRGVFWVTRAKENMAYQVVATLPVPGGNILRDELIVLSTPWWKLTDANRKWYFSPTNAVRWQIWTALLVYVLRSREGLPGCAAPHHGHPAVPCLCSWMASQLYPEYSP